MGRGRAKAKQVKVARQLKYNGGGMDLNRLRAEIGSDPGHPGPADDADYPDRYDGEDSEDDDEFAEDDLGEDADDAAYR